MNMVSEQKKGSELTGQRVQNSASGVSSAKIIQKALQANQKNREQKSKADEISKTRKSKTDEPKQTNNATPAQPQVLLKNDYQAQPQKEGQKKISKQSYPKQEPKMQKQREEAQKQKTGLVDPAGMVSSGKSEGVDKKQNQSKQGVNTPQFKPMDLNFSFKIFPIPNQNAFKMGQQIAKPNASEYKNSPGSDTFTFGNTQKIGQKKMGSAPSSFMSSKLAQTGKQSMQKRDFTQGPYKHPQIYRQQQIKPNIFVNQQPNTNTNRKATTIKKQQQLSRDEQFGLFNDEEPDIKPANNSFEPSDDLNANIKAQEQDQTFYFKRFSQDPNSKKQ